MVKLACMTLPYAQYSFERSLEGIARAGFRYVAFGLPHAGAEVPDESDPEAAVKLKKLFAHYQLQPIMLVSTAQLAPGQPLERARQRFALAKALGIPEVLSLGTWGYKQFPDVPLTEDEMAPQNKAFVEKFREVGALAAEMGVTVTIKPHTGNTATAAVMKRTVTEIGSPHVKMCYDSGNVKFYEGIDPLADLATIAGEVYSYIAKDHRGPRAHHDFPVPGDGEIDFRGEFRLLRQHGYDGPVVVERIDGDIREPLPAEQIDERIAKARAQLAAMLSESGFSVE